MSINRVINKTPLYNKKTNVYEIKEVDNHLISQMIRSRFIGEGVYGIEKLSAVDFNEEYVFSPSFDKNLGEPIQIERTFTNEDIKELEIYELVLKNPLFMPLDTSKFIALLNHIEQFPHCLVFTQILICKRLDNWREVAIQQYESYLNGVDRPVVGKLGMKLQEKMLKALNKISNYSVQREQIEEIEQKILQPNYRFECRFIVYERKATKKFVSYLESALAKLHLFNEFRITKVANKRSVLRVIEGRQFQPELVNQLLSESELYSLLCNSKPNHVQNIVLEKPIKTTVISKNIGDSLILQKATRIMPFSERKKIEVDELKVLALNQSFQRVGIINKELRVMDVFQGASLLKVQMEVPPEITYTSISKKLIDIQAAMGNSNISLEIGDKPDTINFYVPLENREAIYFNNVLQSEEFQHYKKEHQLPFIVGENANGGYMFNDLVQLRHLLVSGTTGSGKSVFINLIILCLLLNVPAEELLLYLIDPKKVEFTQFAGFPQVKALITDMKKAAVMLMSLVAEMDRRYEVFSKDGSRDIQGYNLKHEEKMPFVCCVIDELADLMMVNKEVEDHIVRLGQKARGAGIHLILATQRPSVDVVTGLIKANMPSRIAFAVTSATDSKTILDKGGAEKLLGKGDGLAKFEGNKNEFERFQSPILTLNPKEEPEIFEKLVGLFDGVVVEGDLEEVKELEPIDELKKIIANTNELRVVELARLMGIRNNKLHALMVELVEKEWLRKDGRNYAVNVSEEELEKWRDD